MNRTRKTVAAFASTALLAGSAFALAAAPAQADGPERSNEFRFAGAEIDFQVEKERNRFEVEADIDDAAPGSKWRLVLRHNGKVVSDRVRTADREGEVETRSVLREKAGKDTFKLTVRKVGGPKRYSTIAMR